jgi:hypothetical protein
MKGGKTMNVDPKLLKGLKYRDSERKQVLKDGQKVYQYTPRERDLKPEDVLSVTPYPDKTVIVTADGKKYEIRKPGSQENLKP